MVPVDRLHLFGNSTKEMHGLIGNLPVNDDSLRMQFKIFPDEPSTSKNTVVGIPVPIKATDGVSITVEKLDRVNIVQALLPDLQPDQSITTTLEINQSGISRSVMNESIVSSIELIDQDVYLDDTDSSFGDSATTSTPSAKRRRLDSSDTNNGNRKSRDLLEVSKSKKKIF